MMTIQNQTNPGELQNMTPQTQGTGIFAVPDPDQRRFGAIRRVVVSGITYDQCIQYGFFCVAFKWFQGVRSDTPCPSAGEACTPLTGCSPPDVCFCINGRCQ